MRLALLLIAALAASSVGGVISACAATAGILGVALPRAGSVLQDPAIPAIGDCICWDWIAGGQRLEVVDRTFIWASPEKLFVELRLDLPHRSTP